MGRPGRVTADTASKLLVGSGHYVDSDGSGNIGIFNSSATEIAYFDSNGHLIFLGTAAVVTTSSMIGNDASNNIHVNAASNKTVSLDLGGTPVLYTDSSGNLESLRIFTLYNNLNTAGLGLSAIYKTGAQTLYTNSAPTTLTYTPPAAAGSYRLGGTLDILTGATQTFKVKMTYTDAGGNARTDIPVFQQQNSATLLAGGPAANATGQFSMLPYYIDVDNSGTAITIQDNAGTYTAGTYYWTPILEQLG